MDKQRVAAGAKKALLDLYLWATVGGDRGGNPYRHDAIRGAIRALGDKSGFDLPKKRPGGKVPGALFDLVSWAVSGNVSGNPHAVAEVKAANKALGGDGFDLPEKLRKGAKSTDLVWVARELMVLARELSGGASRRAGSNETTANSIMEAAEVLSGLTPYTVVWFKGERFDRPTAVYSAGRGGDISKRNAVKYIREELSLRQGMSKRAARPEYKTVFDNGRGRLQLGEAYDDDTVKLLTWQQFKKSSAPFKESKWAQETILNALLGQVKQFKHKVEYNSWVKKANPDWMERVDWLLNNTDAKYSKRGITASR